MIEIIDNEIAERNELQKMRKKRWLLWGGVGLGVLLIGGLVWFLIWQQGEKVIGTVKSIRLEVAWSQDIDYEMTNVGDFLVLNEGQRVQLERVVTGMRRKDVICDYDETVLEIGEEHLLALSGGATQVRCHEKNDGGTKSNVIYITVRGGLI